MNANNRFLGQSFSSFTVGLGFLRAASFCLLSLTVFLAGCAHTPPNPVPVLENQVRFNDSFDRVWAAVALEASALDLNSHMDLSVSTIETSELPLDEATFPFLDYARNPASAGTGWGGARYQVRFAVVPISPHNINVRVTARYYRYATGPGAWRMWPSAGRMEQEIIAKLRSRVDSAPH